MMSIVMTMKTNEGHGLIRGQCAKCKKSVFEAMRTLDDCYNVWAGKCPHCEALNFLAMTSLRGYSSQGMDLVLPYDEEIKANRFPKDTPSAGSSGSPANKHGSNLGELLHKIKGGSNA